MQPTGHHVAVIKWQLKSNTSPCYLAEKVETQQLGDIRTTYGMTWKIEQVRQDRSTDRGGVRRRATTAIQPDATNINTPEPKTADELHPSYVASWPDIEASHTPSASLMK